MMSRVGAAGVGRDRSLCDYRVHSDNADSGRMLKR